MTSYYLFMKYSLHCMMEKTLLTIGIFKYEKKKRGLWWTICADIEVWAICLIYRNMAAFRWKMTFRVALTVLFPGVTVKNMTELSLIQSCRRVEMRTRFIVIPGERRRTGGSWAWPGWSLAENLQESLIIEGFRHQGLGLGDAQNAYHSPPGAPTVTVWKNVEVLVYNRNHPKFLQTLNNRGDKAAGPGMQGLHKKDSIWTEHLKLARSQDSGGNS